MTDTWWNCYNAQWGDELVPEAFSHPAKGAPGLSRRIYDHAFDESWLAVGDTVLDPFGGIAGFGLQAMAHGLTWIGVELEPKFVTLGNQNIDLWNQRYGRFSKWGSGILLQGDSRNLLQVIEAGRASGVISSPPFSGDANIQPVIGQGTTSQLRAQGHDPRDRSQSSPGNLGNLRATDAGFAASVASPPYQEQVIRDRDIGKPGFMQGSTQGKHAFDTYGHTPGQLGSMREGDFSGAVSSPPWEGCAPSTEGDNMEHGAAGNVYVSTRGIRTRGGDRTSPDALKVRQELNHKINLGAINTAGNNGKHLDDFWHEARIIVAQTFAALRPGAHAIWVVKSFVRNKTIVDFPGQWRQLCESCGFVTLHKHHAMLVSEQSQIGFDGNHKRKERKSFFRRLAESKGSPRIDFEVVLCTEKL